MLNPLSRPEPIEPSTLLRGSRPSMSPERSRSVAAKRWVRVTVVVALSLLFAASWWVWSNPRGVAPRPPLLWTDSEFTGFAVDEDGRVLGILERADAAVAEVRDRDGRVVAEVGAVTHPIRDHSVVLPSGGFVFPPNTMQLLAWRPNDEVASVLLNITDSEGFGSDIASVSIEDGEIVCGWTPRMLSGMSYTQDYLTWSRWDAETLEQRPGRPPADGWEDRSRDPAADEVLRKAGIVDPSYNANGSWYAQDIAGSTAVGTYLSTRQSASVRRYRLRTYEPGFRVWRRTGVEWKAVAEVRERFTRLRRFPLNGINIDFTGWRSGRLSPSGRYLLLRTMDESRLYQLPP